MRDFHYRKARSLDDATHALTGDPTSRMLAGGTTLIDLMKLYVERPDSIVDINPLGKTNSHLVVIAPLPHGGLRIGSLVRNSDLAWSDIVKRDYPVLSEALLAGASGQIRNMATVGGNLLQRTRCEYFRDTSMGCNKREPGSGCSALDGFNRMHAILGTSDHCIAANPSDMSVALVALDAVVRVRSAAGSERTIPLVDFHLLPGDHPERESALHHDELITAVDLPPLPFAQRSHYIKVRDRSSYAFALASAAVALDIREGMIHDARVALGGVGTKPWRSHTAEKALVGRRASDDAWKAAAEAALHGAKPRRYNRFKIELAKRTLIKTLSAVADMQVAG
jgi:xanthine dehydrogenase YagS FAD-binding subunit